jgi:hypothetical protein
MNTPRLREHPSVFFGFVSCKTVAAKAHSGFWLANWIGHVDVSFRSSYQAVCDKSSTADDELLERVADRSEPSAFNPARLCSFLRPSRVLVQVPRSSQPHQQTTNVCLKP